MGKGRYSAEPNYAQRSRAGRLLHILGFGCADKTDCVSPYRKADYENTDAFAADLASRVVGRVQITTDGWKAYPDTLRQYLLGRLDYAVMIKKYDAPPSEVEAGALRESPNGCFSLFF